MDKLTLLLRNQNMDEKEIEEKWAKVLECLDREWGKIATISFQK